MKKYDEQYDFIHCYFQFYVMYRKYFSKKMNFNPTVNF